MRKAKTSFVCGQCGAAFSKWMGQCTDCGAWNSLAETISELTAENKFVGYAGGVTSGKLQGLDEVKVEKESRFPSGIVELDRVLGGGLVEGSVVLIGGDPGIGKSTLLLQSAAYLSGKHPVLYVTGEESLQQVSLRAARLDLAGCKVKLLAETRVESMIKLAEDYKPKVMIIDSIQTMFTDVLQSAPGSVGQIRESAAKLVRFAKSCGVALYLVGHVTKEGALAGPRVLEHMVDTVLYFEGQKDSRFRVVRSVKNRFGGANEVGIFAMTDKGLKAVSNPSAIFLSRTEEISSGTVVMVTWEGSRPLLVEVQALVDESYGSNARRVTVGIDGNRIAMLLAVLNRHGNVATHNLDVFLNVVGGVRIAETGADLAILLAVFSSIKRKPLSKSLVIFGEVGLGGEIRPVQGGQQRIKEAAKHGFSTVICPVANAIKSTDKLEVIAVKNIQEALEHV